MCVGGPLWRSAWLVAKLDRHAGYTVRRYALSSQVLTYSSPRYARVMLRYYVTITQPTCHSTHVIPYSAVPRSVWSVNRQAILVCLLWQASQSLSPLYSPLRISPHIFMI
jgi:hypothetical protein